MQSVNRVLKRAVHNQCIISRKWAVNIDHVESHEQRRKVCKGSSQKIFITEEIIEAKKLVFGQCQDKLGAYQERKGDDRRSCHLNDLFDSLRTLDMGGVKILLPPCWYVDLGKLPRLAPSEMDMASIRDRVTRLERLTGVIFRRTFVQLLCVTCA